ncbi:MAG: hypothetical protein K8I27_17000 [Planctomycetes bacterium]|nr:hypothetical protein [Planctomycetota bacterium]
MERLFFLLANNAGANASVDTSIDSPMEYYFGALALIALVMTWAWLWLKSRETLKLKDVEPAPETEE